jgi:tetratricopeptide (TPR) repeat protein
MNAPGTLEAIVQRLQRQECVLCLSGRLDTGHSFRSLIEQLLRAVPDVDWNAANRLLATTPFTAAAFARRRLGNEFLPTLIRATAVAEVPEAIQLLSELPFRAFISTSFGDALEQSMGTSPVCTPEDLFFHGHERHVLKLLGRAKAPDSLLVTAHDVARTLADPERRAVLQDVYAGSSLVLLGFSATDADFRLLLEHVVTAVGSDGIEHYAVLSEISDIERDELDEVYGVRVVIDDSPLHMARALCAALGSAPKARAKAQSQGMSERIETCLARLDSNDEGAELELEQLEAALRQARDHERLIDLYVGRVGLEEDPHERAELLIELARVLEREMNDLERAFHARLASYDDAPRRAAWPELERLAAATGRWNDLLQTLTNGLATLDVNDRVDALVRMARLYEDELGHRDYALSSLDMAIELDPEREQAQSMRLDLLRRSERWDELIDALERRALMAQSAMVRSDRYVELADLYETRLGDLAQALEYYRRAVEADPWSPDARLAYEALLRRRGDHAELLRSLEQRLYQAPMDEQVAIRKELAALCDETMGDQTRAIRYYEDLRADAPADIDVLRALARLYEQQNCVKELLGVLAAVLGVVEDNAQRAELCLQMAAQWQKLGSDAQVQESLEWVLAYGGHYQEIFETLAQMYRVQGNWRAAIDVYCRHARSSSSMERARLYCEVARIYETELDDAGCAIDFYAKASDVVEDHDEALVALVRLYEQRESFDDMVDVLERQAEHAAGMERVALYYRAGQITLSRLDDKDGAESFFERALKIDPDHVQCMRALAAICKHQGDLERAAELLDRAIALTPGREGIPLLLDLAAVCDASNERGQAVACYREALTRDPGHSQAASRLSELLWIDGRHGELLPLLQMLVDRAPDSPGQTGSWLRLARAAAATGDLERADRAFSHVLTLKPQDRAALTAYAAFLCEQGQWSRAEAHLRTLARHHEAFLSMADYAELYYRLARCALAQGKTGEAREHQARALGAEPDHMPSLALALEFDDVTPEAVIATKEILVAATESAREKAALLVDISEVYRGALGDLDKALEALRRALSFLPRDHLILHKCLDVVMAGEDWKECVNVLDELIASESDRTVRAKYRFTAAMLLVDKLGAGESARGGLRAALDDDPFLVRASDALEDMLRDSQDWQGLAEHYAATIQKFGPKASDGKNGERARIWARLGQLCATHLSDQDGALCAYEVAADLDSENLAHHQALAGLYAQAGEAHLDKAIATQQRLLRAKKHDQALYQRLEELYRQAGHEDKAMLCASARALVDPGNPGDPGAEPRPDAEQPLPLIGPALVPAMWAQLRHPDQDRKLSALFALAAPVLAAAQARTPAQHGLDESARVGTGSRLAQILAYVASTFGLPVPAAYLSRESGPAMRSIHCATPQGAVPALVIRQDLAAADAERALIFHLARRIATMQPDQMIQHLVPNPRQLSQIIDAAMVLGAQAEGAAITTSAAVTHTAATIANHVTPVALDQVMALGRKLSSRDMSSQEAAARWLGAADHTASRAALAITGDLATCVRLLATEPAPAGQTSPAERVLELVWSSATEELFAVRKHLGRWPAAPQGGGEASPEEDAANASKGQGVAATL